MFGRFWDVLFFLGGEVVCENLLSWDDFGEGDAFCLGLLYF